MLYQVLLICQNQHALLNNFRPGLEQLMHLDDKEAITTLFCLADGETVIVTEIKLPE